MARCTICHTLILTNETTRECGICQSTYHAGCWEELGGCATYGCGQAAPAEKMPVVDHRVGWGDVKQCPKCRRDIDPGDIDCRCGAVFPHADPMTPEDYRAFTRGLASAAGRRRTILGLFLGSLLGFTAPLTGTIAGVIAYQHRDELAGSDGTYLALGYGAAALAALYTLLALLLLAGA